MRTCKRTFFNMLFQPKRVGKSIKEMSKRIRKRFVFRFGMAIERRAHQGQANAILGRHCKVKKYIKYPHSKNYVSRFVRRARL